MIFAFIFFRILFIACMVFIIGYVFGPFARNRTLTVISRVAAILAIVLFLSANMLFFRFGGWRTAHHPGWGRECVHEAPQQ
ncbi:hypothetical protein [uncultured Chitinophaga sp.]|jgi:hypothetical protein|uniref:hypothetical protein n=1 Tax=uncultured Chitinophaga sp. TaxID=339340 RepID=UPI002631BAE0|nr:hypothetical protein [uncultured Chitinophaga sp.]